MLCDEAAQLINDRCDGALEATAEASLEVHLQNCLACQTYAAQTDALLGALEALSEETAPLAILPARRRRSGLVALSGLAAAIALLITAGVFLMREDSSSGLARLTPSATPQVASLSPGFSEHARATLVLSQRSASKYIPVETETSQPGVHLFVLFEVPGDDEHVN